LRPPPRSRPATSRSTRRATPARPSGRSPRSRGGCFYLHYYRGLSTREIAALLGKTQRAVQDRVSRARRWLHGHFGAVARGILPAGSARLLLPPVPAPLPARLEALAASHPALHVPEGHPASRGLGLPLRSKLFVPASAALQAWLSEERASERRDRGFRPEAELSRREWAADQVHAAVLALQDEGEEVRLPELVGPRARSKCRGLSGCGRVGSSSSS
jgi:hypothetical protein